MPVVNVHEAKTQLSRLLAQAEAGEEVVIARHGDPVVRLVPCNPKGKRRFGAMKGKIVVDDGILEPRRRKSWRSGKAVRKRCASCWTRTLSSGGWLEMRGCR